MGRIDRFESTAIRFFFGLSLLVFHCSWERVQHSVCALLVACRYANQALNRYGKILTFTTTSNLQRHLRQVHRGLALPEAESPDLPLPYAHDDLRYQECLSALIAFVVGEGLPLGLVDSQRFRFLIQVLDRQFLQGGDPSNDTAAARIFAKITRRTDG